MALKAFASLRFTGETLEPSLVGDILRTRPTLSYHKGEPFPVGESRRERIGRTGLWLLNTESRADPHDLSNHIALVVRTIFLDDAGRPDLRKALDLRGLVIRQQIDMRVSLFWHGTSLEEEPAIGENFHTLIRLVGGRVETDFDREEPASSANTLQIA